MSLIDPFSTRRDFLKTGGRLAAVSALSGLVLPHVHGAESAGNDTIQLALIGCGGRGTGAASNAMSVSGPAIKLVAMADVSESKLNQSFNGLKQAHGALVDVPDNQKFIGFDGYQKALDCLRPNDIAIFTTPCAFRWVHFAAAIEKGVHVFMEKPLCPDGYSAKKMMELAELSLKKPMKVAVGLMCRHSIARQELKKRLDDGAIGDLITFRTYRTQGPIASCFSKPKPAGANELLWQIERFHSFLWASGGSYSDYMIHNLDECCWMKGALPVKASALGGRNYRDGDVDQNFDTYSVEYIFDDGARMFMEQRNMEGCEDQFASYVQGSKGMAVIMTASHVPAKCRIFKGQKIKSEDLVWAASQPEPDAYQVEWDDFVTAIRQDQPYNEVKRSIDASMTCVMGRMAAHTGQLTEWDDALNSKQAFAPNVDKLTMTSPSPLQANAQGIYPIPMPGILKKTEY